MNARPGALLVCALVGTVAGQEPPAAAPPAQRERTRSAEYAAFRVELAGSRQADEIVLYVERLELRLVDEEIELRADHAVLWGDQELLELVRPSGNRGGDDPLDFGPQVPPSPGRPPLPRLRRDDPVRAAVHGLREIYLEGHVVLRQGRGRAEEVVLAERLYQHLLEQRGVVVDADLHGHAEYQGRVDQPVDVHVRAKKLRALGADRFAAEEAQFSTCAYGHPHWHVQSDALSARLLPRAAGDPLDAPQTVELGLSGNALALEGTSVAPMPSFTADVAQGDSLPLKKLRVGTSSKFGAFGQSLWGAGLPDEARAIRDELALQEPLKLDWETAVDYYGRRGPGLGPALQWDAPGLMRGEIGGYWVHDRADEDFSQPFVIEHPDRGRAYFQNRYTPDEHWRLDTEVSWLSDEGFQPEYFEKEFKEEKEPESYAHLVRQEDTTRARMLYRNRLNDFQSQVDSLPQASFEQIGEPLLALPLPDFLERDGQKNYLVLTHAEDVGSFRLNPQDGLGVPSEQVLRGDAALELSTTLPLGPLSLRPFAAGDFTGWDRTQLDEGSHGRAAGSAGARSELMLHRDFDAFVPWLGIDGARHIALFDVDYQKVYGVTGDPSDLVQIDEVDALDQREVWTLALRQRVQTHRPVGPGVFEVVNVFELDLELPLYPEPERDNVGPQAGRTAGQTAGPLHYDFVHRPGFTQRALRNTALFAEGDWNLHDSTMDVVNLGAQLQPLPEWTTLASWRVTRGVSHVLTGEIDWRIAEKWSIALLEQWDFDANDKLEQRYELRRHGHDFTFAMSFERDRGDGNTSLTFTIYPSFLRRGRAEKSYSSGRGATPGLAPAQ